MAKKNKKKNVLMGTLSKHKNGYGFVDIGEKEDVFIPRDGMNGAMDGDLVEIDLLPPYMWDFRKEAIVTRVRERAVSEVIGTFHTRRRYGFVVPEGKKSADDIYIDKKYFGDASNGDKVAAQIVKYPSKNENAEGKIIEIIGKKGAPGGDITALVRSYGIEQRFPQRVLDEADKVSSVPVALDLKGIKRVDLRNKTIFTIDGADARDFDDAVSCEMLSGGDYLLGVHIADVSHYVREGSKLDREAEKRGTSIYLPDRVIPMLPENLSNGICSLNPREDRLTLTCEMRIDRSGKIVSHEIYESVIKSAERLVYDDVTLLIDGANDAAAEDESMGSSEDQRNQRKKYERLRKKYDYIYDDLVRMKELASILEQRRKKRGSIDFEIDEAEIRLNNEGVPVYVGKAQRGTANKMIEEFMLAANETVAEHFFHLELPFIYRVHERPELTKMHELEIFLSGFGLDRFSSRAGTRTGRQTAKQTGKHTGKRAGTRMDIRPGKKSDDAANVTPLQLAHILGEVKGRPYENVVSTVLLRSMQKAMYDPECKGHFGLALRYYCHFTSPIRRYPDLFIHRVIKEHLAGAIDMKRARTLTRRAVSAADSSSFCEREAIELEREVGAMKKAEYMTYHIGEDHEGVISGVTNFGFFVQLENTVEGLVRFEDIHGDYFDFDEMHYCAVGRVTGKRFTLGDRVWIRVKAADPATREVDFVLSKKDDWFSD